MLPMSESPRDALRCMRIGILLSLFAILFGFGMGAAFGAAEASLKGSLRKDAEAVLATRYGGDPAAAKAVVDKAWVYYQRAHLHGGAMGTAALAVLVCLALAGSRGRLARLAALGLGLGALCYPIYWLWAGARAPGLGSTAAAKESLEWLAVPSSGAALLGLGLAILLLGRALFAGRG
jgi:hypothetical protein